MLEFLAKIQRLWVFTFGLSLDLHEKYLCGLDLTQFWSSEKSHQLSPIETTYEEQLNTINELSFAAFKSICFHILVAHFWQFTILRLCKKSVRRGASIFCSISAFDFKGFCPFHHFFALFRRL